MISRIICKLFGHQIIHHKDEIVKGTWYRTHTLAKNCSRCGANYDYR